MRVVFYPYLNNLGHTVPSLTLADKLRRRGHTVHFRGTGIYGDLVREAGYPLAAVHTFDEAHNRGQQRWMRQWTPEIIAAALASERAALREDEPSLVVADYRPTLGISARLAQVPLATILCADWTNAYPFPPEVPRIAGMPEKIYAHLDPGEHRRALQIYLMGAGRALREAYAAHGVPLADPGNLYDAWRGDLNLLNDVPELAPTEALPPGFHYVGPLLQGVGATDPDLLDRLDPQLPLVYATLGSSGATGEWDPIDCLVSALRDWRGQTVLTTGGQCTSADLPRRFHATPGADGSTLAARAVVTVCTGGSGTVYQSLAQGTPLLCLPRNHNQWYVGDRVRRAGVGEMLTGEIEPKTIRAAVERIASDPAVHGRARNLRSVIERAVRSSPAVDLLEALAA